MHGASGPDVRSQDATATDVPAARKLRAGHCTLAEFRVQGAGFSGLF